MKHDAVTRILVLTPMRCARPNRPTNRHRMHLSRAICRTVSGILVGLLLAACGEMPSTGPYPTDETLIRQFNEHPGYFARLAKGDTSTELLDSLGIKAIHQSGAAPGEKTYTVWVQDLFGAGYCAKGFAYVEKPAGETVDRIPDGLGQCPPDQGRILRPLAGNWYLFYESYN